MSELILNYSYPSHDVRHAYRLFVHMAWMRADDLLALQRAYEILARAYNVPAPNVYWLPEKRFYDNRVGKTEADGSAIRIMHPERFRLNRWKDERGRRMNTLDRWHHVILHEWHHYLYWANYEKKADAFAEGFFNAPSSARM